MYEQLLQLDDVRLNFGNNGGLVLSIVQAFVMFGVALGIKPLHFKTAFAHPKAVLTGFCSQVVLLPAVTFVLVWMFGSYLTATNECGTSIHEETLSIGTCTDIEEVETGISIYPNPAKSNITIVNAENANIEIVNALGQVVYASENISGEHSIDVRNLSNGTYFVKINDTVSKISIVR